MNKNKITPTKAPVKTSGKIAAKKVDTLKAGESNTPSTDDGIDPNADYSVQDLGNRFLVTKKTSDGATAQYFSDTNPLEEND